MSFVEKARNAMLSAFRSDGWHNAVSGIGSSQYDKSLAANIDRRELNQEECDALFTQDDIAKRIVLRIIDDCLRNGFVLKFEKTQQETFNEYFKKEEKRLQFLRKTKRAWRDARSQGGSVILFGIDDFIGEGPHSPLPMKNIHKIRWINNFTRWEVNPCEIEYNLSSHDFNLPLTYSVGVSNVTTEMAHTIHKDRVLRFEGEEVPREQFIRNGRWHDSVFQTVFEPLQGFNQSHQALVALLQESSIPVHKISGLAEMLMTDSNKLQSRLDIINYVKSTLRTVYVDKDLEEFSRAEANVGQIASVLEKVDLRIVSASGMPHNLILGDGAKGGMGANGDTEKTDWNNKVSSAQEDYLAPKIETFVKMIFSQKDSPTGGEIPEFTLHFNPLEQKTEASKADIYLKTAQADQIYLGLQALDTEEIRTRFSRDGFVTDLHLEQDEDPFNEPGQLTPDQVLSELIKSTRLNSNRVDSNGNFFSFEGIDFSPTPGVIQAAQENQERLIKEKGYTEAEIEPFAKSLTVSEPIPPSTVSAIFQVLKYADPFKDVDLFAQYGGAVGAEWILELVRKMNDHKE